eukprot:CAMPEP_0170607924 /NCGR_PEP_ID=MMETSP0224-20130122/21311_1 /TAXON_ID=285029 /ORGANISM="Togula jolla, Strain CCCM 725" /LENGTH=469 /DNA_ID=CAMNT_0010933117 /DNA_START=46 /DNA_END=1455 /DNA_ORIENTATION=+
MSEEAQTGAQAGSSSDLPAEAPAQAEAPATVANTSQSLRTPSRGVDLITGADGGVLGFSISPVAQLYTMVDRLVKLPRVVALPIAERYAIAGKVAAVPDEHPRLVERLVSEVSSSVAETSGLNALYLLETCKELVPGFKDLVSSDRLTKAAELSAHERVKAVVLLDHKPEEWERAAKQTATPSFMMLPREQAEEEEDKGIIYDAGRMVGDATKFVGGAAMGGVGFVTDTFGLTENAEEDLTEDAEGAVDLLGDGVNAVVEHFDSGFDGTAHDFEEKGMVNAVGDGMADAVDIVTDFARDAVHGIAGGVRGALDWVTETQSADRSAAAASAMMAVHRVAIVVGELFGEERTLGLRIENRVVTKFTKPEAEKLGWKLGDCIIGVGNQQATSQDVMLASIGEGKEALKSQGTPLRFLVERMGPRPQETGPKKGSLVFVNARAARIMEAGPGGMMTVQFQDDGSLARVPMAQQ